jgi:hypothetical protein
MTNKRRQQLSTLYRWHTVEELWASLKIAQSLDSKTSREHAEVIADILDGSGEL